jgi:hypothetical protein
MRHHIPKSFPRGSVIESPPQKQPSTKLVRFPCGHIESEARLAGCLRERKNAVWLSCSRCNVMSVAIATIEER